MDLDINSCLNNKNEKFFNENIKDSFDIVFRSSNVDSKVWCTKYRDNDITVYIYAGNDYPNPESFTHEILHLYLFKNGFGYWGLKSICFYEKLKRNIVEPQKTIDGISNAIAHQKMLPIFVDTLKMDKSKFFPYWDRFVTDETISSLEDKFKNDYIFKQYHFTNFIRTFFDSRYHFNSDLENIYQNYQNRLCQLDYKLYGILKTVCDEWDNSEKSYDNVDFFNSLYIGLENYLK